jgi:small basic protein
MLKAALGLLVFTAIAWRIDPASRPYINIAMLALLAWVFFTLGARLDDWLRRMEARRSRKSPRR